MIEGLPQYLKALRTATGGTLEVDVCPDITARRAGFVVHRGGSGPLTIVYLPGLQSEDMPFVRTRQLLEAHATVVSLAWRAGGPHTPAQYAADVLEALDALGIERAVFIGESMGSIPALTLAIHHSQRVQGLVLAGGFTRGVHRFLTATGRLGLRVFPTRVAQWGLRHVAPHALRLATGHRLHPDVVDAFVAVHGEEHRWDTYARLEMIARWDCRQDLSRIACPVFYLGGALDELVHVRREIATLRAAGVALESELIPWCPHPVLMMRPERSSEVIAAFARRCCQPHAANGTASAPHAWSRSSAIAAT